MMCCDLDLAKGRSKRLISNFGLFGCPQLICLFYPSNPSSSFFFLWKTIENLTEHPVAAMRRHALLAFVLVAMACLCRATMPPISSPEYLLEPGDYEMTEDINWSSALLTSIVGNCSETVSPCVTINMGSFHFAIDSTPSITNILISGIVFTNYSGSGPGAFVIMQVVSNLTLANVEFTESNSSFISSYPPDVLVLSNCAFTNNNASMIINIFSNPTIMAYQYMTSITITNLVATDNLVQTGASYNDSLIALQVGSVDVVTITGSNFSANPNIISIGATQATTGLVSDGISTLVVQGCTFSDHPAITVPAVDITSSSTILALFSQTTKSTQPAGSPWLFDSNTFSNNGATFVQANLLDRITFKNNIFETSPGSYAFVGQTQAAAIFQGNRFYASGLLSFTEGQSLDSGSTPSVSFLGDSFDFQSTPSSNYISGSAPVSIAFASKVNFTGVVFANIAPSAITTDCAVVLLQAVTSINFDSCAFRNISLVTSSTSSPTAPSSAPSTLTPTMATQSTNIVAAEIARISVIWTLGETNVANVAMTLKNTTFDSYAANDWSTADLGAFGAAGLTSSLTLLSSPSDSMINISRLAATTTVNVQDPLLVTDMIYNPLNLNLGSFLLDSDLMVDRPVLLYGRVEVTLGSSATFVQTPTRNGSIVGVMLASSNYVPTIAPSASTVISVDLGTGLTVPINSTYLLMTKVSVTLPTQTTVAALHDGSTVAGFSGKLSLTNTSTSTSLSYAMIMTAVPTCSVTCVTGDCTARDYCDCDDGWSGVSCTCLDSGRPAGVNCSSSTTEAEWIATSRQAVSGSLALPSGLTFIVQSDMSITGTIQMAENSLLLVEGELSVSGGIVMTSLASSYPHSCDSYLPTMVASNELIAASSGTFKVNLDTKNIPSCGNTKRSLLNDRRRSLIRDLTNDVSDLYDTILVVNSTAAVDGTLNVDARNVTVAPGKQQQAKLIASNSINGTQLSLMTVNVQTDDDICSTTSRSGSAVSLFFNVCNGTKRAAKWWWYGAPIIAVGAIIIIVIVLSLVVPPWRRAIYPYSAKE